MVLCIECLNEMDIESNLFCCVQCSNNFYKNHCGNCNCLVSDNSVNQYPDVNSRAQIFCSYKCLNHFTENQICFYCDKEIDKSNEKYDWIFHKNVFRIVCSLKCLKQTHLNCYFCLSNYSNISINFLHKPICDKCCLIIKRYKEIINNSYTKV